MTAGKFGSVAELIPLALMANKIRNDILCIPAEKPFPNSAIIPTTFNGNISEPEKGVESDNEPKRSKSEKKVDKNRKEKKDDILSMISKAKKTKLKQYMIKSPQK